MSAIAIARQAAQQAFDQYLRAARATATVYVPEAVVEAARTAYVAAGGRGQIEVIGHGNTTHPVCWVSVRRQ